MKVYIVIGQTSHEHSLDLVGVYTCKATAQKKVDRIKETKASFTLRNAKWEAQDFEGEGPKQPLHSEEYYTISEITVIKARPLPEPTPPAVSGERVDLA